MSIEKISSDFIGAERVDIRSASAGSEIRLFPLFKRTFDFTVALVLLPILAVIAAMIFLLNQRFNAGPLMYHQKRVGKDQHFFHIYKFRTMTGICESARFATAESARINRFGNFLRRTRIDELPQILNVLKGDMSLIGPRPEQVVFYRLYEQSIHGYARRQSVRPGISGLAQLKYGYTSDHVGTQRKLRWDLEYIDRMGFRLEAYIFLQTIRFVLCRLLNMRIKSPL